LKKVKSEGERLRWEKEIDLRETIIQHRLLLVASKRDYRFLNETEKALVADALRRVALRSNAVLGLRRLFVAHCR